MPYTNIALQQTSEMTPSLQQPVSPLASDSASTTRLKAALEHARRLTEMHGPCSLEAALAWETVEEMQTARSRQPRITPRVAFARYCMENPHAIESRIYDV